MDVYLKNVILMGVYIKNTGAAGRELMLRKFHSHQNSKRAHNAGNARRLFGT